MWLCIEDISPEGHQYDAEDIEQETYSHHFFLLYQTGTEHNGIGRCGYRQHEGT